MKEQLACVGEVYCHLVPGNYPNTRPVLCLVQPSRPAIEFFGEDIEKLRDFLNEQAVKVVAKVAAEGVNELRHVDKDGYQYRITDKSCCILCDFEDYKLEDLPCKRCFKPDTDGFIRDYWRPKRISKPYSPGEGDDIYGD